MYKNILADRVALVAPRVATYPGCRDNVVEILTNTLGLLKRTGKEISLFDCDLLERPDIINRTRSFLSTGIYYHYFMDFMTTQNRDSQIISYFIYQQLKAANFNIIIFLDEGGLGYYSMLAKDQGLAFQKTKLIVLGSEIKQIYNGSYLASSSAAISREFMEKTSVCAADEFWSATDEQIQRMRSLDWNIPAASFVFPVLLLSNRLNNPLMKTSNVTGIHHQYPLYVMAFVSTEESAGDLFEFTDAICRAAERGDHPFDKDGAAFVLLAVEPKTALERLCIANFADQMNKYSIDWRIVPDLSIDYVKVLSERCQIVACIGGTGCSTGAVRLVQAGVTIYCREAHRIDNVITAIYPIEMDSSTFKYSMWKSFGSLEGCHVIVDHDELFNEWADSAFKLNSRLVMSTESEDLCSDINISESKNNADNGEIEISICMPTFNRTAELFEAIASLERQTYRKFELILVDDSSTSPEAVQAQLDILERVKFPARRIVQENAGPSVARNRAAEIAVGEYLLFMDDDNVALPAALETFICAAKTFGGDIFTCVAGIHPASEWGLEESIKTQFSKSEGSFCRFWGPPLGACVSVGAFYNCFGDSNALIRKSLYQKLGGFKAFMYEDLEFFMRATLEGASVTVVPEILYLYRIHGASRSRTDKLRSACIESLAPALKYTNPHLHEIIYMARSNLLSNAFDERLAMIQKLVPVPNGYNGDLASFLWSIDANCQADALYQHLIGHTR